MAVEQVQVALASPSQGVAPFTKQEFDGLSLTERSLLRPFRRDPCGAVRGGEKPHVKSRRGLP